MREKCRERRLGLGDEERGVPEARGRGVYQRHVPGPADLDPDHCVCARRRHILVTLVACKDLGTNQMTRVKARTPTRPPEW